ncbi:hypothetical protein [Paenibacillus lentus]|uniref:hypothetical protein n=1 Tax=Paenibacillus lentus TaxID=1338368 RepID=UPI0036D22927
MRVVYSQAARPHPAKGLKVWEKIVARHLKPAKGELEVPDWLVQLAFGTVIGIITFFLKSYKTQQEKRDDDQQEQIDKLNKELQEYKLEAADRYVHKDDFIRATTQTDRKLDKIYDELMKLSSKNVGGGKG